jgi:hypothetical protein
MHLITRTSAYRDAMEAALDDARRLRPDGLGLVGYGVAHLLDGDGKTKTLVPFANLITDAGDAYVAAQIIAGVAPAAPPAPTRANGMKLGTGTTEVAKASTGAALVSYVSGSNAAFDSGYPQTANLGSGNGVNAVYKCSWAAGTATANDISEVVIVNDAATDATSATANTYARALLTPLDKGAEDSLEITWNWKALGA